jgi:hypothetical protein
VPNVPSNTTLFVNGFKCKGGYQISTPILNVIEKQKF